MRKCEVLAPAGSLEDLVEMIKAEVDAIYVGLANFSSRPQFSDMSLDDIKKAITLCHEHDVKLYVAINANVHEADVERLCQYIYTMDEWGIDAVILSEFGIIQQLQGKLKHAAVHASTLLGVYNIETVKMLRDMGVSRIVFYANLYFDEMAAITQAVPELEYELVAEGGTCFNDIRRCRLPHVYEEDVHHLQCRLNFALMDENDQLLKIAKEISEYPTRTAEIAGLFMAIGIHSFKIEGRTVAAKERIPMVNDLKKHIKLFEEKGELPAYLHYFSRRNRVMR